ncbi:hypothetical protein [Kitasatospora viridis]|uniref:SnoaL-like protein n=1 Tax=Kitasatospora viridis TaxID=281105 RepID=A0A561UQ40_9ACTN|nr:hypothetical protein [Kitasatospora viridis]TWG01474.1 hypothetical protein FHX73_115375 [Kitasatospora viridis]
MHPRSTTLAAVLAAGSAITLAACGSSGSGSAAHTTPTVTVTATATATATATPSPTPSPTPTVTPGGTPTVTATPTPAPTVTVTTPGGNPQLTNAVAVVTQYYQDVTNHDYAAAWALGGDNIAGESYQQYVAGFATTASISLGTVSAFGSNQVQAVLYATQTDGSVKVYQGTYTVQNGVLVAASIQQTG